MPRLSRLLAGACAAALLLATPHVASAAVLPSPADSSRAVVTRATKPAVPATFIEALAAVPDATRALGSAREQFRASLVRRARVVTTARWSRAVLAAATSTVHEASGMLARADAAAAASQDAIDDAARTMYTSGGTQPTLAEVMLTADSEYGFTRSLVTRQYLASVGGRVVRLADRATAAHAQAAMVAEAAISRRNLAAAAVMVTEGTLAASSRDVRGSQLHLDESREAYQQLMRLTKVDRSDDYGRIKKCGDWLTRLLSRQGFEGEDLREAWAIVMRESGGREDAVSVTGDLGLFQINTETWRDESWFDRRMLLTRRYNSQVAHQLSRGGRTWYSWGLDGHGRPQADAYVKSGWSAERIDAHIVIPYIQWYAQYPCRPAYEKDAADLLPPLPPEAGEPPALFVGGGQVAG